MALLVLAFSFYIIFCHYACDLTSRMIVTPDKLDIRSFEDVARLGYTVFAKHGTSTAEKLKDIQNLTGLNIQIIDFSNEKLRNNSWFVSDVVLDQAKALILGVSSTFADSSDGLYALALDQPTEILLSFGLQKDSEYTKIFSYHIRRMGESGLLHRLENKWKPKLNTNAAGGGTSATSLGYENVLFPFMGVVVGTIIAVSALLCEMMAAWKHRGKPAIQEGKADPPPAAKYFPPRVEQTAEGA